ARSTLSPYTTLFRSVAQGRRIAPAEGRLGVLLPGLGAVATTFIAGVEAVRRGRAQPIGSLTQMAHIRLGRRTERRQPKIKDFVRSEEHTSELQSREN